MSQPDLEQALHSAKTECATLAEQLRLARSDLHRMGAHDMNRTLLAGVLASAGGIVTGILIGWRLARKPA